MAHPMANAPGNVRVQSTPQATPAGGCGHGVSPSPLGVFQRTDFTEMLQKPVALAEGF
jgi:hypothetical protein